MSRRQMVIPGTGGVLYQLEGGTRAASILELITQATAAKALCCEYGPDATLLEPLNNALVASGYMTLAYEPFAHARPGWEFFDYDWRLDIRYSGQRLAEHLRASRGERWHLVSHSQGGLVVLAAARLLGADELARLVQSVCFVGVPFFGAVNSLLALLEGTFFNGSIPKEVVRTWPAVYQMLPRWGIVQGNPQRPDLLLDATWMNAGLLPAPGAATDLTQHIDRNLLERARVLYRATQTGYFEPLRKLDFVRVLQGTNLETPFLMPHFPDTARVTTANGDGLVPDQFTYDRLPAWVQKEVTLRRLPAAEHSMLCSDANVFGLCL